MKKDIKEKNWFKDETPETRLHLLNDNCKEVQTQPIRKEFSADEIRVFKEDQVKLAMFLDVEDTKKQEFLKEHNAKVKEPKAEHKELINYIRKGFVDKEMTVYVFDNHDDGIMEFYDENGDCVYERPMYPNERQDEHQSINK